MLLMMAICFSSCHVVFVKVTCYLASYDTSAPGSCLHGLRLETASQDLRKPREFSIWEEIGASSDGLKAMVHEGERPGQLPSPNLTMKLQHGYGEGVHVEAVRACLCIASTELIDR